MHLTSERPFPFSHPIRGSTAATLRGLARSEGQQLPHLGDWQDPRGTGKIRWSTAAALRGLARSEGKQLPHLRDSTRTEALLIGDVRRRSRGGPHWCRRNVSTPDTHVWPFFTSRTS
eukprot:1177114-Prorocentrum_minimum.AAC.4